jgi:hypothetical protein
LFTPLPARLAAYGAGGQVVGGGVKPANQGRVAAKAIRLAGEFDEDGLGDVLGQFNVLVSLSQCRRIDEIHLTPNQFREGIFFTSPCVFAEQFNVIRNAWGDHDCCW